MEQQSDKKLGLKQTWPLWCALLVAGVFLLFFRIGHDALWYDESYSVAAAQHPIVKMVPMIGKDSHPPLYFILLRGVLLVCGDAPAAVRLVSALGILGLAFLGFFPLRKLAGEWPGMLFSLVILVTPMSIVSAREARMYSLAAFLVAGVILFGYMALRDGRKRFWIVLSVFTLAAAYTHYFALLAVGLFWLIILIRIVVTRDRKSLLFGGVSALLLMLLYAPWLIPLAGQAARVKSNYWIPPVDLSMLLRVIGYPFSQKFVWRFQPITLVLFCAVILTGCLTAVILYRRKDSRWFIPFSGSLVFILTLLVSVILSRVFRPILMERYMIACMGVLFLGIPFLPVIVPWRGTPAVVALLYSVLMLPVLVKIYTVPVNGPMDQVYDELRSEVKEDDIFIHGSEHNMGTFCYYFPKNRHYLYLPDDFVPFSNYEVFSHRGTWGSDYMQFNDSASDIWVTNRAGEFYSMPFSLIGRAAYRRAAGPVRRFNKSPGWYQVSLVKMAYDPEKTEPDEELSVALATGDLRIVVNNVDPLREGILYLVLFREGPMDRDSAIRAESLEGLAEKMVFTLEDLEYGTYAVICFHDTDNDQKPSFPGSGSRDGLAVTGSGWEEKPQFESMDFVFDVQNRTHEIEMEYFE